VNLDEIMLWIRVEAIRISVAAPKTKWYLFGSVLKDAESAKDIDLAGLGQASNDLAIVRSELASLCLAMPLHLFLLTECEDRQLNFIAEQGCKEIHPGKFSRHVSLVK
jgi:hypothetical protein